MDERAVVALRFVDAENLDRVLVCLAPNLSLKRADRLEQFAVRSGGHPEFQGSEEDR